MGPDTERLWPPEQKGRKQGRRKLTRASQSVKLPVQVRQRLRLWAAFLDQEISELVEEAVTKHLNELDQRRAQRGLPPLPEPETEKIRSREHR